MRPLALALALSIPALAASPGKASMAADAFRFLLATLATWRITHLLVLEDGPWDLVVRLRYALGNSVAGRAMDCFFCTSFWVAAPFALWLVRATDPAIVVTWLALSGAAALLHERTPLPGAPRREPPTTE